MRTQDARRSLPAWTVHMLAGLALAGFVAVLYWALLFTNRVLATGDILLYVYPHRDFVAEALRSGRIPFWNPYLFGGAPLLANTQAAVLYPLHWPLIGLPVTAQVYWSAALHTWLFGYGGYWLLRRWEYGAWPALVTALILAGSGLIGGLIGHLNQLNAAAWLPWAVLCLPDLVPPAFTLSWRRLLRASALLGLIVALMLLAGHSQTVYISLFALGAWAIWPGVACTIHGRRFAARCLHPAALRLLIYILGVLLGALIAAPQLLPTLELNGLGLRSGGLSYLDATSFSLKPLQLLWTLLPTFGLLEMATVFATPAYTEFVAYTGILGLALAGLGAWYGRGPARSFGLLFVVLGLLLALGRWNPLYYVLYTVVPGFDLFRVPARWLLVYTLGAGVLAGLGSAWLISRWRERRSFGVSAAEQARDDLSPPAGRSWSGLVAVLLVAGELLLAARALPHTQPTAPQAVYDLRTAPAHLRSDPGRTPFPAAAGRFLGMSTITYDPGDMGDYRRIFLDTGELTPGAFADLIIAQKVQELLVPNLSLLWRIPALDGFDGGLLPLQRYNLLAQRLVPVDALVPDGRLREQVRTTPPTELLNRLHVQYLITDKVRDLWFEDVYYDRQIGAWLAAGARDGTPAAPPAGGNISSEPPASAQGDPSLVTMTAPLPFAATHLDLIGALTIDAATAQTLVTATHPVATVTIAGADGRSQAFTLTGGGAPGSHLADAALDSLLARSSGATVAYRDVEGGRQEYRVRLPLAAPLTPVTITVQADDPALPVVVQAATLYDARTGMFSALLPSDRGRYALVHSGDVKVYENQDIAGRAYLATQVITATAAADALHRWAAGLPAGAAVVESTEALPDVLFEEDNAGQATIVDYDAEHVVVQTQSEQPALLVLSDTFYPGWTAFIDGAPAEILPANVLFRGVVVPAGAHTVIFAFEPTGWRASLGFAAFGLLLLLVGLFAGLAGNFRSTPRPGV